MAWCYPTGARRDAISAVQSKLVAAGQEVRVDGDFGMKTLNAVVAFQTAHGLTAAGRAGKMTWTALGLHPV